MHHNKGIIICDIVIAHYYIDPPKPMRGVIDQPRRKIFKGSLLDHPCMIVISLSPWPKLSIILFLAIKLNYIIYRNLKLLSRGIR